MSTFLIGCDARLSRAGFVIGNVLISVPLGGRYRNKWHLLKAGATNLATGLGIRHSRTGALLSGNSFAIEEKILLLNCLST
jgi:hypothetical protein